MERAISFANAKLPAYAAFSGSVIRGHPIANGSFGNVYEAQVGEKLAAAKVIQFEHQVFEKKGGPGEFTNGFKLWVRRCVTEVTMGVLLHKKSPATITHCLGKCDSLSVII